MLRHAIASSCIFYSFEHKLYETKCEFALKKNNDFILRKVRIMGQTDLYLFKTLDDCVFQGTVVTVGKRGMWHNVANNQANMEAKNSSSNSFKFK